MNKTIVAYLAILVCAIVSTPSFGADQIIRYTEEMVGAGHPLKSDTLNRAFLVTHNADGTHSIVPYAALTGVPTSFPWDNLTGTAGVTSTELGFLVGVSSSIQTQIGLKAPIASPSFTGNGTITGEFTTQQLNTTCDSSANTCYFNSSDTGDPASPVEGDCWWNKTLSKLRCRNASSVVTIGPP